jgi:hypothetical protein
MDLILKNGKVVTMDENNPRAEAVAIKDGKFFEVGSNKEVLKLKEGKTKIIDLEGKVLLPGFIDSHMHFLDFGYSLTKVDLNGSKSIDEIINRTNKFFENKDIKEGDWLKGRGWNQDILEENRFLNRYDLDKISKEKPIYMTRVCGHVAVVNTKALEVMGVNKNTEQVDGGHFDLDEKGEPTGIFREKALELIYSKVPSPNVAEIKNMILKATEAYAEQGITSVQTDDFETIPGVNYEDVIRAYIELADQGKLKTRIYEQCIFDNIEKYKGFLEKGYRTGDGNNLFKIGPLKVLSDGSLGGRTAYMTQPYADDESTVGIPCYSQEELDEWILTAQKNNMTTATHCIGDAAMYMTLDSIEKAKKEIPKKDMRHSIVHCQITDKKIIKRFSKLNVVAHVQPVFLDYDLHIVEDRIGKERAKYTYNFKRMIDEGVVVAGGSDYPYCEFYQTFYNLHAAINRQDLSGYPKEGWLPEEKLSVDEAVSIFTKGPEYASYEEDIKGAIEKGKLADCFLISDDIYTIDSSKIKDLFVELTLMDGKIVYKK